MEKPADSFNNPDDEFRLEPKTDIMRQSPPLKVGMKKPDPFPTIPFPHTTEDEVYQFRYPNTAYNDGSVPGNLPDGIVSDGTPPRHFGDTPVAQEDNTSTIKRYDPKKRGGY